MIRQEVVIESNFADIHFMFTAEQKEKLDKAIDDPDTEFVFVPSAILKDRIASGADPRLQKLASKLVVTILQMPHGASLALDKALVKKIVNNELDANHAYVFSMGEIRVFDSTNNILRFDNNE